MDAGQIIKALVDEGFASTEAEARAMLKDMGFESDADIEVCWELGDLV